MNYHNELSKEKFEPISNEEIKELIMVAQKGYDKHSKQWTEEAVQARNKVIEKNLRLVYYVVMKYLDQESNIFMDCINDSSFSLVNCIINYDCNGTVKFSTYAETSIKRSIWKFTRENSAIVSFTKTQLDQYMQDVKNYQENTFSENNSEQEILESKASQFNQIKQINDLEMRVELKKAIETLTAKEKEIIKNRYLVEKKRTLNELAEEVGVTGERIRQIEKKALKKLKAIIA